jgi:hypothetical protein
VRMMIVLVTGHTGFRQRTGGHKKTHSAECE